MTTVLHALAKQSANKSTELLRKGAISTGAAILSTGSTSEALKVLLDIYKSASAANWHVKLFVATMLEVVISKLDESTLKSFIGGLKTTLGELYIVDSPNFAVRKSAGLAIMRLALVGFVQEAYDIANELSVAREDLLLLLKVLSKPVGSSSGASGSTDVQSFIHRVDETIVESRI